MHVKLESGLLIFCKMMAKTGHCWFKQSCFSFVADDCITVFTSLFIQHFQRYEIRRISNGQAEISPGSGFWVQIDRQLGEVSMVASVMCEFMTFDLVYFLCNSCLLVLSSI